jgi:hypothetical protein
MTVQVSADNTVARRLEALARLYQQGQASEVMDRTLDKLLSYERDQSRAQLRELQADLAEFEQRYQMSSVDFYRRFGAGQTDDRMDYVEWASLIQMADNLQERLQVLAGEK